MLTVCCYAPQGRCVKEAGTGSSKESLQLVVCVPNFTTAVLFVTPPFHTTTTFQVELDGKPVVQGTTIPGGEMPEGVYRLRYTIVDSAGNSITVSTLIIGM